MGKPHVPSFLFGAKILCKNPKLASGEIQFAKKGIIDLSEVTINIFIKVENYFLGVLLCTFC
jgi:hypothetical protein